MDTFRVKAIAMVAVLLAVGAGVWRYAEARLGPHTSVVIVTIDTLRADHLGCYGDPAAETPHLDAFGDSGCLFEHCYCPVPLTLPSHCTIMTGLYPYKLNVRENGIHCLAEEYVTLAELFQEEGYDTAAVIGAFVLDKRFGLDQGFEFYQDEMVDADTGRRAAIGGFSERQGKEVTDQAVRWLGKRKKDAPFFLWVHYYDPHAVYMPPPPYDERFQISPYDGEIAYTDACFGRLLKELPEDTLVVVVSDHGEALGEHEEATHGLFVYDACVRVPLLVAGPGVPQGRVVQENVRTADIFPTVCELVGLSPKQRHVLDGLSLLPLMRGEKPLSEVDCYAETGFGLYQFGWSELRSVRNGEWKYIQAPKPELFNTREDPLELHNLLGPEGESQDGAGKGQGPLKELKAAVEEIEDNWPSFEEVAMQEISPEASRLLHDLGYIDNVVPPVHQEERADPKDRAKVMEWVGILRTSEGDPNMSDEDRMEICEQVLAMDPGNLDALMHRAMLWIHMDELDRAEKEILEIMNQSEAWKYRAMLPLGQIALKRGQLYKALHYLETGREHMDFGSGIHTALGKTYLRLHRIHDAMDSYQRAVDINTYSVPDAHNGLGLCLEQLGRLEEAIASYERALAIQPGQDYISENLDRCRERLEG